MCIHAAQSRLYHSNRFLLELERVLRSCRLCHLRLLALLNHSARDTFCAGKVKLLPTSYVHVVFTLPHELAPLALQNKKIIYDLLFRISAETLLEIASDPRHLGAPDRFLQCAAHLGSEAPTKTLSNLPIEPLLHTSASVCQTTYLASTPFKSHSVRRTSGFLQVAVSKAPPHTLTKINLRFLLGALPIQP